MTISKPHFLPFSCVSQVSFSKKSKGARELHKAPTGVILWDHVKRGPKKELVSQQKGKSPPFKVWLLAYKKKKSLRLTSLLFPSFFLKWKTRIALRSLARWWWFLAIQRRKYFKAKVPLRHPKEFEKCGKCIVWLEELKTLDFSTLAILQVQYHIKRPHWS